MTKRTGAVTFKGNPADLEGPALKAGDKAPAFKCANGPASTITLADTPAKARLFSVVPSLDTGVCSTQTKRFESGIAELGDQAACYTVSLDLPFAQKRFCTESQITSMQSLSDAHDQSFGRNWGVRLEVLAVPVLARAVFVVDKSGTITHAEYVAEVTHEPNYDAALAALKAAV